MSEIVNYSLKIDAEQRDLLQKKIGESEMTAGNFLSAMLANYEATQSRESLSDVREINQVRNHLARIEEIYIGLAKSRKDIEESHDHSTVHLKGQLESVKAKLVDTQTASKVEVEAVTKQMKELTEKATQDNKKCLLELAELRKHKETAEEGQRQAVKIATLTEQTLAQVQEQIPTLQENAAVQSERAEQSLAELNKKSLELSIAVQELTTLKIQLTRERDTSKRSLEEQQQRNELDKQKAILIAQQVSLTKRETLQDEIAILRDQLAKERERTLQVLLTSNSKEDQ